MRLDLRPILLTLLLSLILSESKAQQDTVFISFQASDKATFIPLGKRKDDPNKQTHFPFNGGKIYLFGYGSNDYDKVSFQFYSYVFEGMSTPFYYLRVDSSYLQGRTIYDEKWVNNRSILELKEIFAPVKKPDPVIMMIDRNEILCDEFFIVRVYFGYSSEE